MTAIANKRRGRAFQSKLAQMAGGINIGTLGGEDVMHEEFSYEAKTYQIDSKTHAGRPWTGEKWLYPYDQGKAVTDLWIMKISLPHSTTDSVLVMLRWYWWKRILEQEIEYSDIDISTMEPAAPVSSFIGNTYMNQAESNCPDAKIPVVVVHTNGKRHVDDIVLVRLVYWKSLLKKLFDKDF
jgi:hypothetical protein